MTEFNFIDGDLPEGRRARDPLLTEFADALRANVGKWAEYPVARKVGTLGAISSNINRRDSRAPKVFHNGFEARLCGGVLYVRFVGDS